MKNATNSQSGNPKSSTLRNPLLYTASVMTPSRNIQTIRSPLSTEECAHGCGLAIRQYVLGRLTWLWHRSCHSGLRRIAGVDWLDRNDRGRLVLRCLQDLWLRQVIVWLLLHGVHHLHALFKRQWLRRTTGQQKRERNQRFHGNSFVVITARLTLTVQTEVT